MRRLKLVDAGSVRTEDLRSEKVRLDRKVKQMFDEQQLDVMQQVVDKVSVKSAITELKRHNAVMSPTYYNRQLRRLEEELDALENPTKSKGEGNITVNVTLS